MTNCREAAARLWSAELAESCNAAFLPLFADEHRYLVLMGGGGSGKSVFAGRKLIERAAAEPGHRFLVCRKVARSLKNSCFRQLTAQLAAHYPALTPEINRSEPAIRLPNGSEILFTGLDDTEKLKSIYGVTGIWIEEASELTEQDFNQLDIRLRGETPGYRQMILSFNPVSVHHWLKRRFFDTPDPRARCHHSTYHDNRFLDEDNIRTLENFRDSDPYYYSVYCLGQWGVPGQSVFPAMAIQERLAALPEPAAVGFFAPGKPGAAPLWQDFADGYIRIYRRPIPGVPYVIGADTAGEGSDSFVAQVLDNRTGRQVATLRRAHIDEDEFARQLYALGRYYNDALIGVETNFSTYTVRELERLRYPRQYVRESMDDYTHRPRERYGFRTDAQTRPVILSELIAAVRAAPELLSDRDTLEEMLCFVRNEQGRPEAAAGAHDDCVMALAIAHHIRPQQRAARRVPAAERCWTADMWEDWRHADPDQRKYLEQKWSPGDPGAEKGEDS
ncbi:MAG: PBSX family phage terminase large subunit [Ruminococcaceae bacterium]|nr:PBSX family phage terminase large subunit [Oscillospiraceae bacterium]